MIKSVFAFITSNVVLYLAFAFIAWEINPANWDAGGRALAVIFGAMFGAFSAAATNGIEKVRP